METSTLPIVWRPIHYLGSKLRIVDSISKNLAILDPSCGTVCDLFAGSGTVAMALASEREVAAADIQEYSRVLCSALLKPAPLDDCEVEKLLREATILQSEFEQCLQPMLELEQTAINSASTDPTLLCDLVENGSLLSAGDCRGALGRAVNRARSNICESTHLLMATRYFGGIYFSYRQTLFIDSILTAANRITVPARDTVLAALLSTASTIVNTVGKQFAQPTRPRRKDGSIKKHLISQMCRDRMLDAQTTYVDALSRFRKISSKYRHRVIRGDYRDVLSQLENVSVIYADPPYTRDHYSRFYHVLETLSLHDSPDISTTSLTGEGGVSRGMYRTDRHQSPFCIKSRAPHAFADLFAGSKALGVPLLLSYSPFVKNGHPRLMTIEDIFMLAKQYYGTVDIVPAGSITHSKLNRVDLHLDASREAEVFLVCRP